METGIFFILPAVIFDVIVGGFLTFGLYRSSRSYITKMPLVGLIIQDGLLYFAVVFVTNMAWIVVHVLETIKANNVTVVNGPGSTLRSPVEFTPLEM
jgi:hypothetical protein